MLKADGERENEKRTFSGPKTTVQRKVEDVAGGIRRKRVSARRLGLLEQQSLKGITDVE